MQLSCKVSCKQALTAAATLLYFMENQYHVDYVNLLQIRGCIREIKKKTKYANRKIKQNLRTF
jgi:hypothetical protein